MATNLPKDSPQVSALLQTVSTKLGSPAETLRQELEAGKFDSALAGMKPQEQAMLQQVLNNPQKLNQIMNSKQARALYDKLTKG